MKNNFKIMAILILGVLFYGNSIMAQNHDSTKTHHKKSAQKEHKMDHGKMMKDGGHKMDHGKMMKDGEHKMDHGKMMKDGEHKMDHGKMMKDGEHKMKNSMVHEGIIDLNAIDKNGDKKVFQDQMDWNVLSDNPGICPICEMKLKEVSIYEAKAKLIENGFKVK